MGDEITTCVLMGREREEDELAFQLRGGPVFEVLRAAGGIGLMPSFPPEGTNSIPFPRTPRSVSFVDLALLIDQPDAWDKLVARGGVVILDVHFPFGDERRLRSIQPGETDRTRSRMKDAEAIAYWTEPKRVMRALDMMASATIVSSPREEWAALLEKHSSAREIHVIPDVVSPESGADFYEALYDASVRGGNIMWRTKSSLWARALALLLKPLMGSMRRSAARLVERKLMDLDIDWEARVNGNH